MDGVIIMLYLEIALAGLSLLGWSHGRKCWVRRPHSCTAGKTP